METKNNTTEQSTNISETKDSSKNELLTDLNLLQDSSAVVWNEQVMKALQRVREVTLTNLPYEEACMMISPDQGKFLSFLVKCIDAQRCLEIGTFTGYSSICIASALSKASPSILFCLESEKTYSEMAASAWRFAGLEHKVQLILGDAMETLQHVFGEKYNYFDFIFIDADKWRYLEYYKFALKLLRPGGIICVDDTIWSGRVADTRNQDPETRGIRSVLEFVRQDARVFSCHVPIFDGMLAVLKLPVEEKTPIMSVVAQKTIDIEGNIAVGKTFLVEAMQSVLEQNGLTLCVFQEQPNPEFLAKFYSEPEKYGFSFQETFPWLIDLFGGNRVFAQCNYHLGNLKAEEYSVYESIYEEVKFIPNVIVYLDASPAICLERAKRRGRRAEEALSLFYLEKLDTFHFQQLIKTILEGKTDVYVFYCHQFVSAGEVLHQLQNKSKYKCRVVWTQQEQWQIEGNRWFYELPEGALLQMAKGLTTDEWKTVWNDWIQPNMINDKQGATDATLIMPWMAPPDERSVQYEAYKRLILFALSNDVSVYINDRNAGK
eukprot:jgi/Galph1/2845/GphlegSOOS_G1533.1